MRRVEKIRICKILIRIDNFYLGFCCSYVREQYVCSISIEYYDIIDRFAEINEMFSMRNIGIGVSGCLVSAKVIAKSAFCECTIQIFKIFSCWFLFRLLTLNKFFANRYEGNGNSSADFFDWRRESVESDVWKATCNCKSKFSFFFFVTF